MKHLLLTASFILSFCYASIAQLNIDSINVDTAPCYGSSNYTINISGGTAPYVYNVAGTGTVFNSPANNYGFVTAGTYTATVTDAMNIVTSSTFIAGPQPSPILVNVASSGPNLCGNTITTFTINASGGNAPYTYNISPGFNSTLSGNVVILAPSAVGAYSVIVTDVNGCTGWSTFVNFQTPPANFNVTAANDTCGQGAGAVYLNYQNGGTPPFTYLWSTGATTAIINNLVAGSYTCVVTDANGCSQSFGATINSTSFSSHNQNIKTLYCSTIDTILNSSAGTPPFTYFATPSVTVNGNGSIMTGFAPNTTYTITSIDGAGCAATVSITSNAVPSVTFVNTWPMQCSPDVNVNIQVNNLFDSLYVVDAFTNLPLFTFNSTYNFAGTNGNIQFSILPGNYNVAVVDANGCSASTVVNAFNFYNPLVLNAMQSAPDNCGAGVGEITASLSGGAGVFNAYMYLYKWINGNYTYVSTSTTGVFTGLTAGNYDVQGTDVNGCVANASVTVGSTSALNANISINNQICSAGTATITATPTNGVAPYSYAWTNGGSLDSLVVAAAGAYTVTISDVSGCSTTAIANVVGGTGTVAIAPTSMVCPGANIVLNAITNAPNSTFNWYNASGQLIGVGLSTSITPNASGLYSVVASGSSFCAANTVASTLVNVYPDISSTFNAVVVPASCPLSFDGAITLASSISLTGFTSYNWPSYANSTSNVASNLPAGPYNILVVDSFNGCATIPVSIPFGTNNCGNLSGEVRYDSNKNCVLDLTDIKLPNTMFKIAPLNVFALSDANGHIQAGALPYGTYTLTQVDTVVYTPNCTNAQSFSLSSTTPTANITWLDTINTSNIDAKALAFSGCVFPVFGNTNMTVHFGHNSVFAPVNATGYIVLDSVQYFGGSFPTPSSTNGDTLFYNYTGMGLSENVTINFTYPVNTLGGFLQSAKAGIIANNFTDAYLPNNLISFNINACTAYDPNDKQVSPSGALNDGYISTDDSTLNYRIRFENNGTAPALNVIILDTLDGDLDISTLKIAASSHPCTIELLGNSVVKFKFLGIMLGFGPPNTAATSLNTGFVVYSIEKKSTAAAGTIITNKADIIFDYNPAITTNTTTNTYYEPFTAMAATSTQNISCASACGNGSVSLYIPGGVAPLNISIAPTCANTTVNNLTKSINNLPGGTYTVSAVDLLGNKQSTIVNVAAPTPLNVGYNASSVAIGATGTINVLPSGGLPPYTYNWSPNVSTTANASGLTAGVYSIQVVDAGQCSKSVVISIQMPDGMEDLINELGLKVYPNPASQFLQVQLNQIVEGTISIMDITGKKIFTQSITGTENKLMLPQMANGNYILQIQTDKGASINYKIKIEN
jgi:hypothetical protein